MMHAVTIEQTEDGATVRYWSVCRRQWCHERADLIPDDDLASMPAEDRDRVLALLDRP